MKHQTGFRFWVVLSTLLFLAAGMAYGQNKPASSDRTAFTVTVVHKKTGVPPISKDDLQLFSGHERKQIADWAKDDHLFLAILIDDSIDTDASSNWSDLKNFIMTQPATTHILVGYVRNNAAMVAQDFTENHELAAKALRIPMGTAALGSSPYLGAMDLLKRWPHTGPRRSIVLITSGIDYFRGGGFAVFSPDLDPLIQRAQRQNTNIWSLYYPSSSHRGRSFYLVNNAQNNLDKLAQDTGAEAFFLGGGTPVSLKPYFDELATHLNNQYLLTFGASGGTKGKYLNVKLKTETPDVEFFTPSAVFAGPGS